VDASPEESSRAHDVESDRASADGPSATARPIASLLLLARLGAEAPTGLAAAAAAGPATVERLRADGEAAGAGPLAPAAATGPAAVERLRATRLAAGAAALRAAAYRAFVMLLRLLLAAHPALLSADRTTASFVMRACLAPSRRRHRTTGFVDGGEERA